MKSEIIAEFKYLIIQCSSVHQLVAVMHALICLQK